MDASTQPSTGQLAEPLTRRERQILALLGKGLTNPEIAKTLTLAPSSVKAHLNQIYGKLRVNSRSEALARARALGLLEAPEPAGGAYAGQTARHPALPTGTVTFLFTDIQGSTPLWEREPEKMAAALQIHNDALRQAIESKGGVVFKTIGDAFQSAFATAPLALQAAIQGQQVLQSAPWNELGPLKVRMGLHTGEAELDPGGDEYAVSHSKNRVARIMSAAYGGQILLSEETAALVGHQLPPNVSLKDLGQHMLKGMANLEHLFQVQAEGVDRDFPPLSTQSGPIHNLPRQLTRFIGRQAEITEVKALLNSSPLVTLTGSGGVGKTRLSIQVAEEVVENYPHGVWYVELAPITDPTLVGRTLARELGILEESRRPIEETLKIFLHGRQALIILDNCEHLIDACVGLANLLLHSCPKLKLLVSSREALGVEGELAYRVPSLPTPDPRQVASPEVIQESEAVKLFVARARSVLPAFQVTPQNAATISQICQRLDGIPLAIELAASRLNLLTTDQLAQRLDKAFRLLTGGARTALPRQQTLRATIDWSYQLLAQPERMLLRRLAVFSGGCTLEAVEEVCSGDGLDRDDILDLLANLVNKSVILADRTQGEETRYRLLETVRQYAREKLFDAGESEGLRDRHLDTFLRYAERAEPHLYSGDRLVWNRRVNADLDNFRAAIDWSFTGKEEPEPGLRIATAIGRRFMQPAGLFQETIDWISSGLESQSGSPLPTMVRIRALNVLSWLSSSTIGWIQARPFLEECISLCRAQGPSADGELSWALWGLSSSLRFQADNNIKEAMDYANESVAIARGLPATPLNLWYLAFALEARARIQHGIPGMEDSCWQDSEESYRLFVKTGDRWSAGTFWFRGMIALHQQDVTLAQKLFEEAHSLFVEVDDKNGIALSYGFLSILFSRLENLREAARYAQKFIQESYRMASPNFVRFGLNGVVAFIFANIVKQDTPRSDALLLQAATLMGVVEELGGDTFIGGSENKRMIEHLHSRLPEVDIHTAMVRGRSMNLEEAVQYTIACLEEAAAESG